MSYQLHVFRTCQIMFATYSYVLVLSLNYELLYYVP